MKREKKKYIDDIPIPRCEYYKPIGFCKHSDGKICVDKEDCSFFKNNKINKRDESN